MAGKKKVSFNEFLAAYVKVHNGGGTRKDLARELGWGGGEIGLKRVASRIVYYKTLGVNLPKLKRQSSSEKIDVKAANVFLLQKTKCCKNS
jgi:hypothetical protein